MDRTSKPEVGSNELHLLRYIYLSNLVELYEDLLLDEHRVCCLLFHRYRPRYHYDITSLLYIKYNV